MPKLRHIALATNDPERTAAFYKQAFGFEEVGRVPDTGNPKALAHGVYLSDGTINLAILKFRNVDQLGKGLDYVGLHHFGVIVDDTDAMTERLEGLGAACVMQRPDDAEAGNFFEIKFRGPDGVVFDISDEPWIGSAGREGD